MLYNKEILLERLTRLEKHLNDSLEVVRKERERVEMSFSDSYNETYLSQVMMLTHKTEILVNDIRTTL